MFLKVVCQQYVGEVSKSITVMLQVNSVHRVPNIIKMVDIHRNYRHEKGVKEPVYMHMSLDSGSL